MPCGAPPASRKTRGSLAYVPTRTGLAVWRGHGAGGEEEESDEQPPHTGIIANPSKPCAGLRTGKCSATVEKRVGSKRDS